jgi:hypothetical protein
MVELVGGHSGRHLSRGRDNTRLMATSMAA